MPFQLSLAKDSRREILAQPDRMLSSAWLKMVGTALGVYLAASSRPGTKTARRWGLPPAKPATAAPKPTKASAEKKP